MKAPRWLTLAALALVGTTSAPARAQWVPGGTVVLSNVPGVFGDFTAVPDGESGALVFVTTLGAPGVVRVGPDGTVPPGWPSTAIQGSPLSSGLAADGAGGAYVGRVRQGPSASQIVVRHLLSDGSLDPAWPPGGRVVADLPGGPQGIQLASDGAGGVYAVFVSNAPGAGVMGVLRLDITGAASPGWPAAGVTIASGTDDANYGDVHATGAGIYVTGFFSSTVPATAHDAFIGHVSPTGTVPAGWGAGSVPVPFLPAGFGSPPFTVDTAGGVYFTWTSGFVGRLVHLLPDASPDPAWPVRGLALLADTTHWQILYKPVSDGGGGCFARFAYDSAGTNVTVVPTLVHITASTTPEAGWPLLGARLPYVFNGFSYGDVVPDGLGGAYATWFEGPTPTPVDGFEYLRAHHIASGGVTAPYWPASGLTLASGPGQRIATKAVTDTHGGAIVSWRDLHTDPVSHADTINVLALGFGPDGTLTTSVGDRPAAIAGQLHASPVPARGPTSLVFALTRTSAVHLDVMDVNGRRVRRLLEGTFAPGPHAVAWDGLDEGGRAVPPGVYIAHAGGEGVAISARLVRIR